MSNVERLRAIASRAQDLSRQGHTVREIAEMLRVGRATAEQMVATGNPAMRALKAAEHKDHQAHFATIAAAVARWEKAAARDDNREFRNADNALGLILSRTGPRQVNGQVYRYDAGSDAVVRAVAARPYLAG